MQNPDLMVMLGIFVGFYAVAMIIIVTIPMKRDEQNRAKGINQRLNYRCSLFDAKIKFVRAAVEWFLWIPLLAKKERDSRTYTTAANRLVALGIALPLICLLSLFGHAGTDWAILAGLVEYLLVGLLARRVIKQKRQHLSCLD